MIHFNIIRLTSWSTFWLSHQNTTSFLFSASCSVPLILLHLIVLIILGKEVIKILIMQFSQTLVISSLCGPNILLSSLFSNSLSLCSSLNVKNQVSHPYRTKGKITVLYILIFTFAKCWKVAGSNPDEVIGFFFNLPNPSSCTRPWSLVTLQQQMVSEDLSGE
jgi:hypothetical protein